MVCYLSSHFNAAMRPRYHYSFRSETIRLQLDMRCKDKGLARDEFFPDGIAKASSRPMLIKKEVEINL